MTPQDRKWIDERLRRLERRIRIAMFVAVALGIVFVELYELASPQGC